VETQALPSFQAESTVYRAPGNSSSDDKHGTRDRIGLAGLLNRTTCLSEEMLPYRLVSHAGSGMAVAQHLYGCLLEFFRVNATWGPVLLVELPGALLDCSIRVHL
jgi:hypothetical protein